MSCPIFTSSIQHEDSTLGFISYFYCFSYSPAACHCKLHHSRVMAIASIHMHAALQVIISMTGTHPTAKYWIQGLDYHCLYIQQYETDW